MVNIFFYSIQIRKKEIIILQYRYAAASSWLKVTPFGFRRMLKWLSQYGKPIIVTENGFSDFLGNLDDMQRIYYYKHYINQMLKAIRIDGVDVDGYFAWSLMVISFLINSLILKNINYFVTIIFVNLFKTGQL